MNPTYYTVTRFLWSIALKCDVWFRLTYERTYLPERGLYRDRLVHSEIVRASGVALTALATADPLRPGSRTRRCQVIPRIPRFPLHFPALRPRR